jgi:hypothetical protein
MSKYDVQDAMAKDSPFPVEQVSAEKKSRNPQNPTDTRPNATSPSEKHEVDAEELSSLQARLLEAADRPQLSMLEVSHWHQKHLGHLGITKESYKTLVDEYHGIRLSTLSEKRIQRVCDLLLAYFEISDSGFENILLSALR